MNRTFLLIIGGLAGLLILGLVAAGVLLFLPSLLGGNKAPVASASQTPTKVAIQPTATQPKPAASPTSVVSAGGFVTATPVTSGGITTGGSNTTGGGAGSGGAMTATPVISGGITKGGTGGELPSSGLGDNLLWLAAGLGLVAVIFIVRYARASG